MAIKNICVYCGSREGNLPAYADGARALAKVMLQRGIGLVYGGASIGLMGAIADAIIAGGGRAIGVIPGSLLEKEVGHSGLTELHVTQSMHERKALMADLSDAFIALPGGIGTFEEIFEIWTWAQLGFHDKPCGILDVAGYYEKLAEFLDQSVTEGFVSAECRAILSIDTDAERLLDRFEQYRPPAKRRWIVREQT